MLPKKIIGCLFGLLYKLPRFVFIQLGFGEAISRGFSNYFTSGGRASKPEYWRWMLFAALSWIALLLVGGFVTLIPSLAVTSRRLHDIGKSGWWLLLWLIPVIGRMVLIVWAIKQGEEGPNKYGPDPTSRDLTTAS